MSTRFVWPCAAIAACCLMAGPLAAQDATQKPKKPWYKAVSVNAFVLASYSYNINRPATHFNAFRVFDYRDNRPRVDVAELVVQKPVSPAIFAGDSPTGSPFVCAASSSTIAMERAPALHRGWRKSLSRRNSESPSMSSCAVTCAPISPTPTCLRRRALTSSTSRRRSSI